MAKKITRRTITADNGATVKLTAVKQNGRIVNDGRNGMTVTGSNGVVVEVPLSAGAMTRTEAWLAG